MSEQSLKPEPEPEPFTSKAPFSNGMNAAATSAAAGVLVSAVQNSVQKHDKGAIGVFTRTGSTIALFTAMGGVFAYTDAAVANARQKNDALNGAAGGCAAGLIAGASMRSVPLMFGSCAGLAALIGTFDAAGSSLTGRYPRASPADLINAQHEEEGHGEAQPKDLSWREAREQRRKAFFKPKKNQDVESE